MAAKVAAGSGVTRIAVRCNAACHWSVLVFGIGILGMGLSLVRPADRRFPMAHERLDRRCDTLKRNHGEIDRQHKPGKPS